MAEDSFKTGNDVNAYFASLRADAKFEPVSFDVGCDYHSGQDGGRDDDYQKTDHLFDLFYGGRHQYYGYMDLFDNVSKSTANGGLVDLYAGFKYKVAKNSNIALDYHYFSLQNNVMDPYQEDKILNKSLGSEFDLTVDVAIIPEIVITGGFSTMLTTGSMDQLQRKSQGFSQNESLGFPYWGYVMITAKPTLFKSDK